MVLFLVKSDFESIDFWFNKFFLQRKVTLVENAWIEFNSGTSHIQFG